MSSRRWLPVSVLAFAVSACCFDPRPELSPFGASTGTAGTTGGRIAGTTSGTTGTGGCPGVSGCCTPTTSQTVYAHSPSQLFTLDPSTWTPVLVGTFSVQDSMTDLAVTPAGVLYTVSETALYQIDPATAAATLVMPLEEGTLFNALTFQANGSLLGADSSGDLTVIDPVAKTQTLIGNFGGSYTSSGDLVAVADGTLYATSPSDAEGTDASAGDLLLKIDPASGVATEVGPTGLSDVWGLGYYGGTLIAFTDEGQIARIDPQTGASKLLNQTTDSYWGAGVSPLVSSGCP